MKNYNNKEVFTKKIYLYISRIYYYGIKVIREKKQRINNI